MEAFGFDFSTIQQAAEVVACPPRFGASLRMLVPMAVFVGLAGLLARGRSPRLAD